MKKYYHFILIIIPLFYLTLGIYFHQINGIYSVRSADPEYIFFMNGLNLANGNFRLGNIDHPSIPLDYLVACTLKITHSFRSTTIPFNEDVLANPDLYLKVVNFMMILTIAVVVCLAGYLSLKIIPNIWYALIIQFSPFATEIVYGDIGRITTELLLPIPVIFLTLMVLKILTTRDEKVSDKSILILALISAIGLSMKLTYLPFLLIPLFIMSSWKQRIIFAVGTLVLFLVIAIPVTLRMNYFYNWTKSLFLHSGQYGHGKMNIIDFNTIIPNIKELIASNTLFFILTFIFILSFILRYTFLRRKQRSPVWFRAGLSLILVLAVQVLAVSKHFKTHYFIVTLMLLPLIVIITLELTSDWIPRRLLKIIIPVCILLVIGSSIKDHLNTIRGLSVHFGQQNEQRMKAYYFFKIIEKDCIKIMVPGFYGSPTEEYALMNSYQWAGKYKPVYEPVFKKLYPRTYILYHWDKTLHFWGDSLRFENLSQPAYIYFDKAQLKEELSATLKDIVPDSVIWEKVFNNPDSGEIIFRLSLPVPGEPKGNPS